MKKRHPVDEESVGKNRFKVYRHRHWGTVNVYQVPGDRSDFTDMVTNAASPPIE